MALDSGSGLMKLMICEPLEMPTVLMKGHSQREPQLMCCHATRLISPEKGYVRDNMSYIVIVKPIL